MGVTLIGGLFITVLSFIMIMSVWNANKAADIKKDIASVKNAISFSIVLDLLIKTRVDFRKAE